MKTVLVTVELTNNNYSAYLEQLPGCVSTGKTFEELQKNMAEAVEFHLEGMREDGDTIPFDETDYRLAYQFDSRSLLQHYDGVFTHAALERLTGINQRQLQRYASGISKPRSRQAAKISSALHCLGKELLAVKL